MQYASAKIRLTSAHSLATGKSTTIAVIDSGVDTTHPELADVVEQTFNAAKGDGLTSDDHGTAVAGVIGARGVLTGVAPAARLLAVQAFFREDGLQPITMTNVLLRAISWSYRNGARILNMSFSGPADTALSSIFQKAREKGMILVAAAGNGGPEGAAAYPAAYESVIAVTEVAAKDNLYGSINRGEYVAIAAPGVDIFLPGHDQLFGAGRLDALRALQSSLLPLDRRNGGNLRAMPASLPPR
ncbi:MAG: S8 family serine peptidase [Hyphomicrobiaceae bacterium]